MSSPVPAIPAFRHTRKGISDGRNVGRFALLLVFALVSLALLAVVPSQAGTIYSGGSPQLSAAIAGSNEVNPGDDLNLSIMVRNTGLNPEKFVAPSNINREEPPNLAKSLTIALLNGDAPVVIKSDPQMVGDLPGAANVTAKFNLKVNTDAPAGTYLLPLAYRYTYLYSSDVYDNSTIKNTYRSGEGTIDIMLKIKPDIAIDVLSATAENLDAGSGGYVDLTIRNAGYDYGQNTVVKILRNGNSPIQPNDSSVFIGDFPPGAVASCRYRVFVAPEAQPQVYPVDVVVMYRNSYGDYVMSRSDTVGLPVRGKVDFAVVSDPVEMNPGSKMMARVVYRNTGAAPVYSAQARIVAVPPFTTSDDISSLGDIPPGASAVATFGLTTDSTATIKEYGLDSEVRYRDAINNSYVSDSIEVRVNVTREGGLSVIATNPVYLSITILAVIVVIMLVFRFRKKIQQRIQLEMRKGK